MSDDEEDILAAFVDYDYGFTVGAKVRFGIMTGHIKEILHERSGCARYAIVDDEHQCLHLRYETELEDYV